LEGVEAVGPTGDVVVATPDLDHVDRIIVSGRPIPVLPLSAIQVLLDATGNRERAAMVAKVLGGPMPERKIRFGLEPPDRPGHHRV
jgi:hypothetical protein